LRYCCEQTVHAVAKFDDVEGSITCGVGLGHVVGTPFAGFAELVCDIPKLCPISCPMMVAMAPIDDVLPARERESESESERRRGGEREKERERERGRGS
jgi:hypothetical protein